MPGRGRHCERECGQLILGIGVDLVDIPRMERTLKARWAERFLARVFSPEEIAICERAPDIAEAYAARFAAKEAVAKALGSGFSRGVAPAHILIRGGERARPTIELMGVALNLAQSMGVGRIHLSFTHARESACAFAVVEST